MIVFFWVVVLLLAIVGIISYGWAKLVLGTLLVILGVGMVGIMINVIGEEREKRHAVWATKQPRVPEPRRDPDRVLVQAAALARIKPKGADAELTQLRKMAGLE